MACGHGRVGTRVHVCPHRHHSVQLIMTLGSFRIRGEPVQRWRRSGAAWIRADAPHEVDARGGPVLIAFIEAESELGAALSETICGDIAVVDRKQVANWRGAIGPQPTKTAVEQWLREYLLHNRRPIALDPRIRRVMTHIRRQLGTGEHLSLKALAAVANMSPSHLMHTFTRALGVPIRPYIRWLRRQRAACELMKGSTTINAAHHAGFADAAHMTRTFRDMLGTTPTDLALRKRAAMGVSIESNDRDLARAVTSGIRWTPARNIGAI
jgi:AraC-like DNA-binding protein